MSKIFSTNALVEDTLDSISYSTKRLTRDQYTDFLEELIDQLEAKLADVADIGPNE